RHVTTRDLRDLLIAERLGLLYSPSGAGKSSLIQAALIPELEAEGFRVLPPVRVNREPPAGTISVALGGAGDSNMNRYVLSVLLSIEDEPPPNDQAPETGLSGMKLATYLERRRQAAGMD